jgi:hypothetical protein
VTNLRGAIGQGHILVQVQLFMSDYGRYLLALEEEVKKKEGK